MEYTQKGLQEAIIKNGGFIFSNGTLNLLHLLTIAYDLMKVYEIEDETLKEDILKCFVGEIENKEHSMYLKQYHSEIELKEDNGEIGFYHGDLWSDITDKFNDIAPDGYYFGSSEGDGACIGWFKYEDGSDNEEEDNE